jgi:hypothetical protein
VPNSNSFKAIPLSIYQCLIYEIWIFVGWVSETLCALANAWQHGNPRQPAPHPYLGKSQKVLISLLLCFLTKKSKVVKCAFYMLKGTYWKSNSTDWRNDVACLPNAKGTFWIHNSALLLYICAFKLFLEMLLYSYVLPPLCNPCWLGHPWMAPMTIPPSLMIPRVCCLQLVFVVLLIVVNAVKNSFIST